MSYLHILNLYKPEAQGKIFLFREAYVLEKIHGTSAHITFKTNPSNKSQWQIVFFSGGEKYNNFIGIFDADKLMELFLANNPMTDREYTVYGEAYGGSQQGMSHTYGKQLKFIAFDVQIGDTWLDVPNGEKFVNSLGLEYVPWNKVSIVKVADEVDENNIKRGLTVKTDLTALDMFRDAPSMQAVRNGISKFFPAPEGTFYAEDDSAGKNCEYSPAYNGIFENPKRREGIVIRPLVEVRLNNGDRIIAKHKGDAFKETATPRAVVDENKLQILTECNAIAEEWTTPMRLEHVLDKLPGHKIERMKEIITAMQEDVRREGKGEMVRNEAVAKAIGKKTVDLYKAYLQSSKA